MLAQHTTYLTHQAISAVLPFTLRGVMTKISLVHTLIFPSSAKALVLMFLEPRHAKLMPGHLEIIPLEPWHADLTPLEPGNGKLMPGHVCLAYIHRV